ncbi:MAG: Jag N-terminal domain-containing protein [Selenomonadaceae bacterium]|nr:Jag N-terminal domain-containing protein [Selenomonadaceae bacterium]
MANVIERTGKTIDEAIAAAAEELGVDKDELDIEILETPTKRLFGLFGETPAKIRATVKEPPEIIKNEKPVVVEEPARLEEEISAEEPAEKFEPVLEPSPVEEKIEPFDRDKAIDAAEDFLREVFATMNLEVIMKIEDNDEEGCLIELSGKGLGILIGRRGQALDALQYLLNLAVNRKHADEKVHFVLDVEDYRRRREQTLIKLAKSVAERVIKTRRDVKLEPMNRHERKIIHTVLQDNDRVDTHSAGEEPYRYIVVSPKRGRR